MDYQPTLGELDYTDEYQHPITANEFAAEVLREMRIFGRAVGPKVLREVQTQWQAGNFQVRRFWDLDRHCGCLLGIAACALLHRQVGLVEPSIEQQMANTSEAGAFQEAVCSKAMDLRFAVREFGGYLSFEHALTLSTRNDPALAAWAHQLIADALAEALLALQVPA